jgi:hypothetical protein
MKDFTHAMQVGLHFQSDREDDRRFDAFVEDLKVAAARHGVSLGELQSMRLPASEYRIAPCSACGHLTVNSADVADGIDSLLPDFWFHLRRGTLRADSITCELCGAPT